MVRSTLQRPVGRWLRHTAGQLTICFPCSNDGPAAHGLRNRVGELRRMKCGLVSSARNATSYSRPCSEAVVSLLTAAVTCEAPRRLAPKVAQAIRTDDEAKEF